jgi:hypothetical protein
MQRSVSPYVLLSSSARPPSAFFPPTLTCRRCLPVRPLCRIKRSHEHDDNADEADKNTHRRKRVRRNAYTGKLKKRSPEAIAAVAAELQKQDRMCVAIYLLLPSHARGLSLTATSFDP